MSSADYREPTNEELWAQPPTIAHPNPASHGMAHTPTPTSRPPVPVPAPVAPVPVPVPQQRTDRTVFTLAIVSMALGIPLTAIAGGIAGLPGLFVVWVGIVLVNVVYARSRRH